MSMTVPSTPTTPTTLNDTVSPAYISRYARDAAVDPLIGELIAHPFLVPAEVGSFVFQVPLLDEMAGAAVVTIPNAAPEAALTSSNAQITSARIALRSFVADDTLRVSSLGPQDTANRVIKGLGHNVRDFVHQGVLGRFTSIAATEGNASTAMDLANLVGITGAFQAQNHDPGPLWITMHTDQLADFRTDLVNNAAGIFASTFGDTVHRAALDTTIPGLMANWGGYSVYASANVPVGDTTGWTGAVGVGGELGGLKMPIWISLTGAMQRDEARFGTWMVISIHVGYGIEKQANLRSFVSRAA
jgi:hypothetical protein